MNKKKIFQSGEIINNCSFLEELTPIRFLCGSLKRIAKFKCFCGKEFITQIEHIKHGNTTSCRLNTLNLPLEKALLPYKRPLKNEYD